MPADSITIIIPAYNEATRLGPVLESLGEYDVVVINDASEDATSEVAREAGATVIEHRENRGYIESLKDGFDVATGDIIVTMDADGEHDPADIPRLVAPIEADKADVVFGARDRIPRPSERLLDWLARRRLDIRDTGTGFRALRSEVAQTLTLDTVCTCGTFALEAKANGARLANVHTPTETIEKPRSIAYGHGRQLFHVFGWLWRL